MNIYSQSLKVLSSPFIVAYSAKYSQTLVSVIKDEFSGTLRKVLVAFVEAFVDYPTFLASRLEKTMV
jgi:hypothetical protein